MKNKTQARINEITDFLNYWKKDHTIEKIKGRYYIVFTPKCCWRTKRIGLYDSLNLREWGICPRCRYRMVRFGRNDMLKLKDKS